jgi:hypothetical protein
MLTTPSTGGLGNVGADRPARSINGELTKRNPRQACCALPYLELRLRTRRGRHFGTTETLHGTQGPSSVSARELQATLYPSSAAWLHGHAQERGHAARHEPELLNSAQLPRHAVRHVRDAIRLAIRTPIPAGAPVLRVPASQFHTEAGTKPYRAIWLLTLWDS